MCRSDCPGAAGLYGSHLTVLPNSARAELSGPVDLTADQVKLTADQVKLTADQVKLTADHVTQTGTRRGHDPHAPRIPSRKGARDRSSWAW